MPNCKPNVGSTSGATPGHEPARRNRGISFRLASAPEATFKIARSIAELEQAYRILCDCYVEYGYMQSPANGMRLSAYNALPGTYTVIALWNGEVVGSVTIIKDSAMGLPMEAIIGFNQLRREGRTIAEFSGLSISKAHRRHRIDILFPLIKHTIHIAREYLGIDTTVIAINPRTTPFFDTVLLFEPLHHQVIEHYDFVNGAPAEGRYLDLRRWEGRLRDAFSDGPADRNVYEYMIHRRLDNLIPPEWPPGQNPIPAMTPATIDYFFKDKTNIFQELSPQRVNWIFAHYASRSPHTTGVMTPMNETAPESAIGKYDSRLARSRTRIETVLDSVRNESNPETLALFLLNFCSLGVSMTKPVPHWIRTAAERCIDLGFERLGKALIAHARHEEGHDLLMRDDTAALTRWWNERYLPTLEYRAFLDQPASAGVRGYIDLHEATIASRTPFCQIAIEYEIEQLSVTYGPQFIAHCIGRLGTDVRDCLSFLDEHVRADVGHTQYNRRILEAFLTDHPGEIEALVNAGDKALCHYGQFLSDCLSLAQAPTRRLEHEGFPGALHITI
jgi:hypothetical protein